VSREFGELQGLGKGHLQLPKSPQRVLRGGTQPQKDTNPWIALVSAAHIKGALSKEIKLTV